MLESEKSKAATSWTLVCLVELPVCKVPPVSPESKAYQVRKAFKAYRVLLIRWQSARWQLVLPVLLQRQQSRVLHPIRR
jgi:hypothetical protein